MSSPDPNVNKSFPLDEWQQNITDNPGTKTTTIFPTTLSDLTFQSSLDPTSNKNIYKTLSALRKSTLSIPNRIFSVLQDTEFIEALHHNLQGLQQPNVSSHHSSPLFDKEAAESFVRNTTDNCGTWPLIPNERSGSWPLPPQLKIESQQPYLSASDEQPHPQPVSAYFKSTDGHVNQWSFSTRRLNLPVLELLGSAGGAVLIDTTRRGKAYPDALRRTVPIFTSVWNHTLFDDLAESGVNDFQGFGLEKGEMSQIESRLPGFVQNLKSLGLSLEEMRKKIKRPIRCIWVAQPSSRREWETTFEGLAQHIKSEKKRWEDIRGVNILICCSASRRVLGAEMSDEGYIQGAGDDSEGWSQGLTARVFWDNKDQLMTSIEAGEDIEDLVRTLVQRNVENRTIVDVTLVKPTANLYLGAGTQDTNSFDLVIDCNSVPRGSNPQILKLGCKDGKLGSKMLRDSLPMAETTVQQILQKSPAARVLVTCSTGRDLSVGVVLMLLCRFYDDHGSIQQNHNHQIDKQLIKQRLAWITSSKPDANPSRATLQAVNSVLIDRPR